ncbi:hypothetical protein HAX54_007373, partial [Datura stramonium]|nr:hypothetical protein [Datura stramonium]
STSRLRGNNERERGLYTSRVGHRVAPGHGIRGNNMDIRHQQHPVQNLVMVRQWSRGSDSLEGWYHRHVGRAAEVMWGLAEPGIQLGRAHGRFFSLGNQQVAYPLAGGTS